MTQNSALKDWIMIGLFSALVLTMPIWFIPQIGGYLDLFQRFAIFGLFAIGFNILFGLTGYLSFGHAAFLGVGSYTAVWTFKALTLNPILAMILAAILVSLFAVVIGYLSLRRSGIYFSILTLAFAQMSYNMAYSVLTPVTNGETGLRVLKDDPRFIDRIFSNEVIETPVPSFFGLEMQGYSGFYFCAAVLIIGFIISVRIARSPFGLMLKAIKTNQVRMNYTGFNTRPYLLTAFVISGAYAGVAGALLAIVDPLAGAERMVWTASGEVVLMTILGGVGTLIGPFIGAAVIKWLENIVSSINESMLDGFFGGFLPDAIAHAAAFITGPFVGEGWHLLLGVIFVVIVIFLPGGIMEGMGRIGRLFRGKNSKGGDAAAQSTQAE